MFHYSYKKIESVYTNRQESFSANGKPIGIWYAGGDDWDQWCKRNNWGHGPFKYKIEVNYSNTTQDRGLNKVLRINTLEEMEVFINEYACIIYGTIGVVDWPEVSKDFGGVEINCYHEFYPILSQDRIHECTKNPRSWILGLDANSECVWNKDCVSVVLV